jgi:hypothetical protein
MAVLVDAREDVNRVAAFRELLSASWERSNDLLNLGQVFIARGPHKVHQNL